MSLSSWERLYPGVKAALRAAGKRCNRFSTKPVWDIRDQINTGSLPCQLRGRRKLPLHDIAPAHVAWLS
jgi:hypothetical protein